MQQNTLPQCLQGVILSLLEDLDTPRSLTVSLLIRGGEFGQLCNLKVDPLRYQDASLFFRDVQATELLRKCSGLPTGIDTASVALDGFWSAERQCHQTNLRLDRFLHNGPFETPQELAIADFLDRVKRFVTDLLGPLPRDLNEFGRFGPGATFRDRGLRTTVLDKMSSQPTVTTEALCFSSFWEETAWFRALVADGGRGSSPEVIRGNRFTTVPKDATKDRGIAVEPSLNMFYQLAVGSHLRRRLKRHGIDLDDGQHRHRLLARDSSVNGALATMDLSSASDTVAYKLVQLILPSQWFQVLDALRSPFTLVNGSWVKNEKFSSMGNGFTFELETLVFYSIVTVALLDVGVSPEVYVYGDDIIYPSEASPLVSAVLRYFGFTPNMRKSFSEGFFRESCGGDFFRGVAVRPHYLKEYPDAPHKWIALANGFRRVASDYFSDSCCLGRYQRAWFRTLDALPSAIRGLRGPSALGDIVIHDSPSTWRRKWRSGVGYIRVWRPVSRPISIERWDPVTQLAGALYGVPSSGPIPRSSGSNRISGYRFGRVAYS